VHTLKIPRLSPRNPANTEGVLKATEKAPSTRAFLSMVDLSRASYRKMWQNLVWATGYNAVSVPLAAGVLAFAGVMLSPAAGAVLMSASTIVVALNAQLLRRVKLNPCEVR
jgi:Cu2+-exporting ATPase